MMGLFAFAGWVVLYTSWQVALVVPLWLGVRALTIRPGTRYVVGLALFAWIALLPMQIFANLDGLGGGDNDLVASLLPWLGSIWSIGVLAKATRLVRGIRHAARLRSTSAPAADEWRRVAGRDLLGDVPVLESEHVDSPTATGYFRAAIIVPSSASELSPAQRRAILAHEMAHIRRRDALTNLLQAAVHALFFYHPGVWWLSRELRDAREQACDDAAVSVCDAVAYARALAMLEHGRSGSGLAINGGSLLNRIRRLVEPMPARRPGHAAALTIATLVLWSVLQVPLARELDPGDDFWVASAPPLRAAGQFVGRTVGRTAKAVFGEPEPPKRVRRPALRPSVNELVGESR
jgi:Zn-dependent protease with chaperone function